MRGTYVSFLYCFWFWGRLGGVRRGVRRRAYLALLDLVPAFDEVLDDVQYDGAAEGHVHLRNNACQGRAEHVRRNKSSRRATASWGYRADSGRYWHTG